MIVGVGALIAANAFGTRLRDVAEDGGAWGAPFELFVELGDVDGVGSDAAGIAAIPGVAEVTVVQYADVIDLGEVDAPGFGVRAVEGPLALTAVEGRAPASDGEVLLGVRTADALGLAVGDVASMPTVDDGSLELRVVGLGLVPVIGDGAYDTGVVVLDGVFERLHHDDPEVSLWVGLADEANADQVSGLISSTGAGVGPIEPPSEKRNLESVLGYPGIVGLLVAVLRSQGSRTRCSPMPALAGTSWPPCEPSASHRGRCASPSHGSRCRLC